MNRILRRGAAAGVAASLLLLSLAACGGDDDAGDEGASDTTTAESSTTEGGEDETTTEPGEGTTAGTEATEPEETTASSEVPDTSDAGEPTTPEPSTEGGVVSIVDFDFDPTPLTVAVDTEVTWTNDDTTPHTATSEDDAFDSSDLPPGEAYSYVFREAGTFAYVCDIHPNMAGEVIVE